MTAIQLRSRHLDNAGGGLNALTVEVYATDANGLPTGAAVASTTTDADGVWQFLAATGLLHSTRYCVKIINGSEVQWLDGADMIQAEELAVRTKLTLPNGAVVGSDGIPNAALAADVARANLLTNGGFEIWQRGAGPFTAYGAYGPDRWFLEVPGSSTLSVTKNTVNTGLGQSSGVGLVAVRDDADVSLTQHIKMAEFPELRGQVVSLSMRANCNAANAAKAYLGVDGTGGGGVVSTYHAGNSAWATLTTASLTIPTDATYMEIKIHIGATSTTYVDHAMLVVGSVAADYQPLHPADEWARCLRYAEYLGRIGSERIGVGYCNSTTVAFVPIRFTPKAVIPTITISAANTWSPIYGSGSSNPSTIAADIPNINGADVTVTMGSAVLVKGEALLLTTSGATGLIFVEANP